MLWSSLHTTQTALYAAATEGHEDVVKALLSHPHIDSNKAEVDKWVCAVCACVRVFGCAVLYVRVSRVAQHTRALCSPLVGNKVDPIQRTGAHTDTHYAEHTTHTHARTHTHTERAHTHAHTHTHTHARTPTCTTHHTLLTHTRTHTALTHTLSHTLTHSPDTPFILIHTLRTHTHKTQPKHTRTTQHTFPDVSVRFKLILLCSTRSLTTSSYPCCAALCSGVCGCVCVCVRVCMCE